MITCFLFLKHLTETHCQALTIDENGITQNPLQNYSFAEINQFQTKKIIALLPCELVSIHQLQLAWLPEKKARTVIPFALEEKLADAIENLHFAFDKHYHQDGHYVVAVTKKESLEKLLNQLNPHIKYDLLTVDWFALTNNEICILNDGLLINDPSVFQGKLPNEVAEYYLNKTISKNAVYQFLDSSPLFHSHSTQVIDTVFPEWLAKRMGQKKLLNIAQGPFQKKSTQLELNKWYYAIGIMLTLGILLFFINSIVKITHLNQEIKKTNQEIAIIYKEFFPKAQQVISPQYRIQQLLKSKKNEGDTHFWLLLNYFSEAANKTKTQIDQIRYQNQKLKITVVNNDFKELETLQTYLLQSKIQVKQEQASTKNNQVISTLELYL